MLPRLPAEPLTSGQVVITGAWVRAVFAAIRYAMTHPRGDDLTIMNDDATGQMRAPRSAGSASGGSGGSVEIGVMTVRPNGGYGPAAYRKIRIDQDGTWTAIGADIPIVIPKL